MLSLPFAVMAEESAKVEFIRVDEDAAAARLQTALTRYEKDGVTVDLIGAIHIADKAYYQDLSRRFAGYDSLLFEMVGGEKFGRKPAATTEANDPPPPDDKARDQDEPPKDERKEAGQSALHQIYKMAATFLGLAGQMDQIDYNQPNFVHADLTQAEFDKMQRERGESLLGFALNAAKEGQAQKNQPDPAKLLDAMLSGKSNLMKLEIVHTLGQGDDQIGALAGESVILTDRNARCLEVLAREIKAGTRNLGIFYGAAHFNDLSKQLEEQGFKRAHQEWLTAWHIPKPKKVPKEEPGQPHAARRKAGGLSACGGRPMRLRKRAKQKVGRHLRGRWRMGKLMFSHSECTAHAHAAPEVPRHLWRLKKRAKPKVGRHLRGRWRMGKLMFSHSECAAHAHALPEVARHLWIFKLFEGVFLYPSDNVIKNRRKPINYFGHSQCVPDKGGLIEGLQEVDFCIPK